MLERGLAQLLQTSCLVKSSVVSDEPVLVFSCICDLSTLHFTQRFPQPNLQTFLFSLSYSVLCGVKCSVCIFCFVLKWRKSGSKLRIDFFFMIPQTSIVRSECLLMAKLMFTATTWDKSQINIRNVEVRNEACYHGVFTKQSAINSPKKKAFSIIVLRHYQCN